MRRIPMLLSQNFPQNSPFATLQKVVQNPNQSTSKVESVSNFDALFTLASPTESQTSSQEKSFIPLNKIALNLSLALGFESQTPTQDLKLFAFSHSSEFLKSLDKAKLTSEKLNPLSYPRSISVISELMNEKLEELYATTKDPNDPKLHLLLGIQEQFVCLDSTMQTLRNELTNKAEMLASLLPHTINEKSDLFLDRAQAVWESASNFKAAAQEGVAWINAFFSTFEADLSTREKNLIFEHANIIQTYWHIQSGGEDGKITLENGMVYQEYFDEETPNIFGFTLITQNFVYAYREEVLEDGTTQVVLQVYEKSANGDSDIQSNIIAHCSYQMQKSLDFHGQNLKLIGEASRIEKRA